MTYYCIEPEVAGELGSETVLDSSVHPPIIRDFHFMFSGWLGDSILECFPCYLVTEELKSKLEESRLTGVSFDHVKVSKGEQFSEIYGDRELPIFSWLRIKGSKGDDFFMSEDHLLVVSEAALQVLRDSQIDNCDIEPYSN